MLPPELDDLGNHVLAYEVAITAMLQVLAKLDPAIGKALAHAMRDINAKLPAKYTGVYDKVNEYIRLVDKQVAQN